MLRLARIAIAGLFSVGIAWGCGSSDDSGKGRDNLGADAAAGTGGSATGGSGGATTGGSGGTATGGAGGAGASGGIGAVGGIGATGGVGAGGTVGGAGGLDAGLDASAGTGGTGTAGTDSGPPPVQCDPNGADCTSGSECCSRLCNPVSSVCEPAQCFVAGSPCDTPDDCCTSRCEGGSCQAAKCIDDGASCSNDGQCCSGTCDDGSGLCTPLNITCDTAGNSCSTDAECCSKYCNNGVCDSDISWCTQTGDICSSSEQCCSGRCALQSGKTFGTCDPIASGAGCSGKATEGEACPGFGDCAQCCSKLCTPDPDSGRFVCAPTLGCKTEGSLCRRNEDCCGYAGSQLPGDGNGACVIEPGAAVGFCKTTGCIPQGQVCKYDGSNPDYICEQPTSDPNSCCGATGNSGRCILGSDGELRCNGFELCPEGAVEDASCSFCQVDTLGIPRCNGLGECRQPGETCSSAADCCNQVPCVPDDQGILRCLDLPDAGPQCVDEGGSCSGDADCCPGFTCIKSPGSVVGVCGNIDPPPPTTQPDAAPPPECAAFGQACSAREDCCNFEVDPDYGCFGGVCKLNPN